MKTLKQYREEVLNQKSNPHSLADLSVQLAADLAYYQEQYGEYEIEKAKFMDENTGKDKMSVAACEYKFLTTEDGIGWERLKRKIKGIEGLQKGLTNISVTNTIMAKNQA